MIQKKKVLSTLLSTAACLSLMCGTAFAAEGQTDLTGDTEATSTTTTITGTITPVQLKAAVPTNIAFAIDPIILRHPATLLPAPLSSSAICATHPYPLAFLLLQQRITHRQLLKNLRSQMTSGKA